MGSHEEIERNKNWNFDFQKLQKMMSKLSPTNGVVPVVVQDFHTKDVLILAYANWDALQYTLEHQIATFWSTSRNELWIKGKTSGDILKLKEIRVNCDQNSLLYLVEPQKNGACHVKDKFDHSLPTCYYRTLKYDPSTKSITLDVVQPFEL
jgi:phosphoribosyl-AMP cyclohydrolase